MPGIWHNGDAKVTRTNRRGHSEDDETYVAFTEGPLKR